MGIPFTDIDDAVLVTQRKLIQRGAFLDLQTDLQDHVAVREMWKGRQKVFDGGEPWRFDAQIDHNHSAKAVELYETDGSAVTDTMIKGTVTPKHMNAHYIYDQREPDFQKGGHAIVNLIKTRYVAMQISFFELLEEYLWGAPDDSSDSKKPYGVAFWVQKYDNDTGGFYATNPSGFSDGRANIDSTAGGGYGRWANYSRRYTAISKEDLIRKMRKASRQVRNIPSQDL